MVYAIIITTTLDGAKHAVGDPIPVSEAREKIKTVEGDDLAKVEIFELREHSKRRKLARPALAEDEPAAKKAPAKKKAAAKKAPETNP